MNNKLFRLGFLVILLVLSACARVPAPNPTSVGNGNFHVENFTGVYTGTWSNNTTGASGPARIEIVADETNRTATLTIDFDGQYLGLVDPPAQTLTASYDENMAHAYGSNPLLFGDYDVTIDADGNIIGVMKNLAAGAIPEMTYTGTVGKGRLDADYIVKFVDGKTVNSILRLERAP